VKKYRSALFFLIAALIVFISCKRINESTTLGGDLIPPVDNVHTFEVSLNAITTDKRFNDSSRVLYNDLVALGHVTDPEFGTVDANFSVSFSSPAPIGAYPFLSKPDSLPGIDSVVLSLSYAGAYGDTAGNNTQTAKVSEILPSANFRSDTAYLYSDASTDFAGTQIGTKTYQVNKLKDTTPAREIGDTAHKYVNVLRIRLNNSLGTKLADFDTSRTSSNAGYSSDSAFKKLFPGLKVSTSGSENALAYFNLANTTDTKLIVYYTYKHKNNVDTTGSVTFTHSGFGQANYVKVQPGGEWQAALASAGPDDKVFMMSTPSGAYSQIVIPDLSTFANKVIHRAEILAVRVPAAGDNFFNVPFRLFLDRNRNDTNFLFSNDLSPNLDGSIDFSAFGGTIRSDNTYRINISRYVQGIVTRHEPNDTLRLYAILRAPVFNPLFLSVLTPHGGVQVLPTGSRAMEGRVVLGGGNYPDPNARLRLRIIYSDL
jgi:hypothetical protein